MMFSNDRKMMDSAIQKAQRFEQGSTDAIQQADHSLMQQVYEENKSGQKTQKITAVSDNMKFGRGKKSIANHF